VVEFWFIYSNICTGLLEELGL